MIGSMRNYMEFDVKAMCSIAQPLLVRLT